GSVGPFFAVGPVAPDRLQVFLSLPAGPVPISGGRVALGFGCDGHGPLGGKQGRGRLNDLEETPASLTGARDAVQVAAQNGQLGRRTFTEEGRLHAYGCLDGHGSDAQHARRIARLPTFVGDVGRHGVPVDELFLFPPQTLIGLRREGDLEGSVLFDRD